MRLPDLPGPGHPRLFALLSGWTGGWHLLGYVGTANAKEYEAEDKNPLLIIPASRLAAGLEKSLEPNLRGTPGGQRIEVTARGKLVKELDPNQTEAGKAFS